MSSPLSRREILKAGTCAVGAMYIAPRIALAGLAQGTLITKVIPSTGERLPAVGLGTNNYSVDTSAELASRREVLRRMPELGGSVVDTAPAYGRSEIVIGQLVKEIGNRDRLFIATKVTAPDEDASKGVAMLEDSFKRLGVSQIDLMQVHNLNGVDTMMPILNEWKADKRIRYIGATTSNEAQHENLVEAILRYRPDFIQVNYSIDDRAAADRVLPLARERGAAVLLNIPFGGRRGGNLLQRVAGRALPDWASELDATSWAQFFLKYAVSHPAVTCAIPGTTRVQHLEDNQGGARGVLPDAAMRKRMEEFWEAVSG